MKEVPFTFGSDTWPGMVKVIEEAGELLQVLGKLQTTGGQRQYWEDVDLYKNLEDELADIQAAIVWFVEYNRWRLDADRIADRIDEKFERFTDWHYNGDEL